MFNKTKIDTEYIIKKISEQAVDYMAKTILYDSLYRLGEKELRYSYMKLYMEYYRLSLEMEAILCKFGVEPDFDWFENHKRKLA